MASCGNGQRKCSACLFIRIISGACADVPLPRIFRPISESSSRPFPFCSCPAVVVRRTLAMGKTFPEKVSQTVAGQFRQALNQFKLYGTTR